MRLRADRREVRRYFDRRDNMRFIDSADAFADFSAVSVYGSVQMIVVVWRVILR